jgi:hypothetical protein
MEPAAPGAATKQMENCRDSPVESSEDVLDPNLPLAQRERHYF